MPPITSSTASTAPSTPDLPRLIVYHQTHHTQDGTPVSALPLIGTGVTHVYIAAIHLNDRPEDITLNDHAPGHERNKQLWEEVKELQRNGIKVLGMLGGAAKGSYERLGKEFETHYAPLKALLSTYSLDGLDLDIEEPTPLSLTTKLLTRLRQDFGPSFILTLAPVLPALLPLKPYLTSFCHRLLHPELPAAPPLIRAFIKAHLLPSMSHMSGFNHFELESSEAGRLVSWYNVQFYCGWGDAGDARLFEAMVQAGWDPGRVVLGVLGNPGNGSGYVEWERLRKCVESSRDKYASAGGFGGVMVWEYFNAGGSEGVKPEEYMRQLGRTLERSVTEVSAASTSQRANIDAAAAEPPLTEPADTQQLQSALSEATLASTDGATPPRGEGSESTPTGVDQALVQRLVDMGSDRAEAIAALEAMGGDVGAAADILFGE